MTQSPYTAVAERPTTFDDVRAAAARIADHVHVVPARQSPLKDPAPRAAASDRLRLVELAFVDLAATSVDPREIRGARTVADCPIAFREVSTEVLVLEGERVEAGQVVTRLVADDARLAADRARARARPDCGWPAPWYAVRCGSCA